LPSLLQGDRGQPSLNKLNKKTDNMNSKKIEEIEDEIQYLLQSINHAEGWRDWKTSQLWVSLPKDESKEAIEKVHQEVDQEVEEYEKEIFELENRIS